MHWLKRLIIGAVSGSKWNLPAIRLLIPAKRGMRFSEEVYINSAAPRCVRPVEVNPLLQFFNSHNEGPGIWKWMHYFDIYHRHFSKFVGQDVHIMEIGIYSGGSLQMWKEYFGKNCQVYGIDIEKACRVYESDGIKILIGDQSDRAFWKTVKESVPRVDILIDDGGHHPEHQIISLEEMLPHLSPGGVYLCEDIHGAPNYFASYVSGLAAYINSGRLSSFSSNIDSLHLYPFVVVLEKCDQTRAVLKTEKRGTQWQPFFK